MKIKWIMIALVVLMICGQTVFAQGRTRDDRQVDQEATYQGGDSYGAYSPWDIGGRTFGFGQYMLLRANTDGKLWTTFFFDDDGSQAYSISNSITANATSPMNNIGLATNDRPLNWSLDAIGDVDGDGQGEALITKVVGSQRVKKLLFFGDNGTVSTNGPQWQNSSAWVVEGIGTFDTEYHDFWEYSYENPQVILLRNPSNGRLWTTYIGTSNRTQHYSTNDFTRDTTSLLNNIGLATNDSPKNWTVDGIGDVNDDYKDEIVISKVVGSQRVKKILFFGENGIVATNGPQWQNSSAWVIEGMGSFYTGIGAQQSGYNSHQILMRNPANGRLWTTFIGFNGSQYFDTNDFTRDTTSLLNNIGLATNDSPKNWVVQAILDVNGDDKDEIVITKTSGTQLLKKTLFFGDNGTVTTNSPQWSNSTKWIIKGGFWSWGGYADN